MASSGSSGAGSWAASAGFGESLVAVGVLMIAGYSNVYGAPPAPWRCCEPIVVSQGAWERLSLQADGSERGRRALRVRVCCDDAGDAAQTAVGVHDDLAGAGWQDAPAPVWLRVVACDVGRPRFEGRDGSGRWVWAIDMEMEAVVTDGRQG